jgi:hypothetical protein
MPLGARKMNGGLRKQNGPKIKGLRMLELAIATIPAAQAASMCLQLRMEERAASGTEEVIG